MMYLIPNIHSHVNCWEIHQPVFQVWCFDPLVEKKKNLKKEGVVRRLMKKIVLEIVERKQRMSSHKCLFGPWPLDLLNH